MPLSLEDVRQNLVSYSKDLVADQTFLGLTVKLNTSGAAFDVVEGLGEAALEPTVVFAHVGGFDDQRATAVMKYVSPSTNVDHEIGVLLRVQTFDGNDYYYYARIDDGDAKITKVVNGSFTTLTQGAFPLPPDTLVTITFEAVGTALSATFDAGGSPTTVNLAAVDSDIPSGGLMGFRTRTTAGWCRSFAAEEL